MGLFSVDLSKHELLTREVLGSIAGIFDRYIAFPSEAARVATILWVAHTHVYAHFQFTPRLTVMSGESGTGKTTVMDIIAELSPKGKVTVYPQPAVLMRKAEQENKVTFVFDEIQKKLGEGGSRNSSADFQSVLLAGFQRGGTVERTTGSDSVREYNVFAPAAMGGRGILADDLMNRAVNIHMKKSPDAEHLEDFRPRIARYALERTFDLLDTWARKSGDVLEYMGTEPPPAAKGRRADIWEPLIAIAELAGPDWLESVLDACRTLETIDHNKGETDVPLSVKMLRHIEKLFHSTPDGEPVKGMSTKDIIDGLTKHGWDARVISPKSLAKVLREFDIESTTFKPEDGGTTTRGYLADQFHGLWGKV